MLSAAAIRGRPGLPGGPMALRIADCGLRIDCRLQIDCGLQIRGRPRRPGTRRRARRSRVRSWRPRRRRASRSPIRARAAGRRGRDNRPESRGGNLTRSTTLRTAECALRRAQGGLRLSKAGLRIVNRQSNPQSAIRNPQWHRPLASHAPARWPSRRSPTTDQTMCWRASAAAGDAPRAARTPAPSAVSRSRRSASVPGAGAMAACAPARRATSGGSCPQHCGLRPSTGSGRPEALEGRIADCALRHAQGGLRLSKAGRRPRARGARAVSTPRQ